MDVTGVLALVCRETTRHGMGFIRLGLLRVATRDPFQKGISEIWRHLVGRIDLDGTVDDGGETTIDGPKVSWCRRCLVPEHFEYIALISSSYRG